MTVKVLITGQGGQLAWELEKSCPNQIQAVCLNKEQLDICLLDDVYEACRQHSPDWIINAAAYTAVDKAETEIETAYAINHQGSENLALACKAFNAKLIHVSTDFVFDGEKTTPYTVDDKTNPINVYGASKWQGEQSILETLPNHATIIRTAWVYSAHGNNFVKTMLRLMEEKDELGIVADQVGTPTWAKGLAELIWHIVKTSSHNQAQASATLHWTDAGVASWYDFAVAIQELAFEKGMLNKTIPVRPISATSYPTPAQRPSFSVLDKSSTERATGYWTRQWRKSLSDMLDELKVNR